MGMREQVGYRDTQTYTLSLISLDISTYMSIYLSAMYLFIRLSITPIY